MKFNGSFDGINKHFNDNLGYYLVTILFLATGMIIALYCVKYMQSVDKNSLINYITAISTSPSGELMSTTRIFINTLKNNLPIIIGLWILGLTFIGIPIVLLINLYKGFSLGFTFSFFIYALKERGFALALLGVLPQNLIYVPCIIFLSVIAMKGSVAGIKEKFLKKYVGGSHVNVANYTMVYVVVMALMSVGFLIETFLTPIFIRLVLKGVGA